MRYKISNRKPKTWNDKNFVEADLVDTNGELFTVSAWKGEFDGVEEWEGVVEKNDKGYFKLVSKKASNMANLKTATIEKTMERKEKSISNFQDNKEWSIKLASSMGKAVDLAIAELKDPTVLDTLPQSILKWRMWILENWDVEPKDIPPFK